MTKCINKCGECPFFEWFIDELEDGIGMVGKGRCHKWNEDEILETKTACSYIKNHSIEELEKEAYSIV